MSKNDKKIIKNHVHIIMYETILAMLALVWIVIFVVSAKYVEAVAFGVGLIAIIYNIKCEYKLVEITLDVLELDSVRDYLINK